MSAHTKRHGIIEVTGKWENRTGSVNTRWWGILSNDTSKEFDFLLPARAYDPKTKQKAYKFPGGFITSAQVLLWKATGNSETGSHHV